jgi:hypothetical protein
MLGKMRVLRLLGFAAAPGLVLIVVPSLYAGDELEQHLRDKYDDKIFVPSRLLSRGTTEIRFRRKARRF